MSIRIIFNGKIHTQDPRSPLVSALAMDHERILATGEDSEIKQSFPYAVDTQDLHGATVIPGLTDAHIHLESYAFGLQKIDCEVSTKDECLRRVAEKAQRSSPGTWIFGHGWNQNDWEDGYGTSSDLDEVSPNNPVILSAKSLHSVWVNNLALKLAGVNENTSPPPGGDIQRDSHGYPTGILIEKATELVSSVIPEPTLAQVKSAILTAQDRLIKMGITGIHDFDHETCFSALQAIQAQGRLKLRVTKSIPFESLDKAIDLGLRSGFGNDRLRIGGIKLFMDGALGPHTAAMIKSYEDDPDNRGIMIMDNESLFQVGKLAAEHGLSLAIHAIGDRANHETLMALERLREFESANNLRPKLRHRIEHVQILDPQDIPRLADLDIIASMQPIHALSDMKMADRYWGRRATFSYAWKHQLEHGAVLAFGSDAPVESPNPFWGVHAAITRRRADGFPGPAGWFPEQRLKIAEAIHAYTIGPAYAAGMENDLGRLAPGYLADLIVLDRDFFSFQSDEIRVTRALGTMVAGEWAAGNI